MREREGHYLCRRCSEEHSLSDLFAFWSADPLMRVGKLRAQQEQLAVGGMRDFLSYSRYADEVRAWNTTQAVATMPDLRFVLHRATFEIPAMRMAGPTQQRVFEVFGDGVMPTKPHPRSLSHDSSNIRTAIDNLAQRILEKGV